MDDLVSEELVNQVIHAHVAVEPPPPSTPFDRIALINFDETETMEELVTKMKELQGALLDLREGGSVYGE
ncbi:hypothetical protein [Laceyella tengchongensis]|jgi:hypothetical protein|uniref:hypothetical protein n=1 Tax=Laceyella tengchongensis TaxID=574699 RepID=UPI0012B8553F|nr:hypothetical protein [Laceyella tengchongensis]